MHIAIYAYIIIIASAQGVRSRHARLWFHVVTGRIIIIMVPSLLVTDTVLSGCFVKQLPLYSLVCVRSIRMLHLCTGLDGMGSQAIRG